MPVRMLGPGPLAEGWHAVTDWAQVVAQDAARASLARHGSKGVLV
jgi:hypothetical protein